MRGPFNIGMCFLLKAFLFTIFMSSSAVQKITQRQVSNRMFHLLSGLER